MARNLGISAPQLIRYSHVNRCGSVLHGGLNAVPPDLQLRRRATDHCVLLGSLRHSVGDNPPPETRDISVSVRGRKVKEDGGATHSTLRFATLVGTGSGGYYLDRSDSEERSATIGDILK